MPHDAAVPSLSFGQWLKRRAPVELACAAIVSLMNVATGISCAALLFQGPLEPYMAIGIGSGIVSSAILPIAMAMGSSMRFSICGPSSISAAITALMITDLLARHHAEGPEMVRIAWVVIVFSSVVTGGSLILLGWLKLGKFFYYLPYPVTGGFLAASGWLLCRGSLTVMTGSVVKWGFWNDLGREGKWVQLAAGIGLAMVLWLATTLFRHGLILPILLVVGTILIDIAVLGTGESYVQAQTDGWFLPNFSLRDATQLWTMWGDPEIFPLAAETFFNSSNHLFALLAVVVLLVVLGSSGVEIETEQEANLDRELQVSGVANLAAGAAGGIVGMIGIVFSALTYRLAGDQRRTGIFSGILCMIVLFLAAPVIGVFPKPVMGGLLFYLGFDLLYKWTVKAFPRLSLFESSLILAILAMVAFTSYLQGIALGIVIACLLFVYKYSQIPVVHQVVYGDMHQSNVERPLSHRLFLHQNGRKIEVNFLHGYLFFGTANQLLERVHEKLDNPNEEERPRFLLFDMRMVPGIDSSAAYSMSRLKALAAEHDVTTIFTRMEANVLKSAVQFGLICDQDETCKHIGELDSALQWCEDQLLGDFRAESLKIKEAPPSEDFDRPEILERFSPYLERIEVKAKTMIFAEGDAPLAMYFLEEGRLSVWGETPEGQRFRRQVLGPGAVVGEMGLILNQPRSATVYAEEKAVLHRLTRDVFQKMMQEEPERSLPLVRFVSRQIADRLATANQELSVFYW